jgi:hypothetical protein
VSRNAEEDDFGVRRLRPGPVTSPAVGGTPGDGTG